MLKLKNIDNSILIKKNNGKYMFTMFYDDTTKLSQIKN